MNIILKGFLWVVLFGPTAWLEVDLDNLLGTTVMFLGSCLASCNFSEPSQHHFNTTIKLKEVGFFHLVYYLVLKVWGERNRKFIPLLILIAKCLLILDTYAVSCIEILVPEPNYSISLYILFSDAQNAHDTFH